MTEPKQTRPRKTAAEKATIELDKATARLQKAEQRVNDLGNAVLDATTELDRAKAFHAYAAANPDLPAEPASSEPTPA